MYVMADVDKLVTFLRAHREDRLCDECVRSLGGIDGDVDAGYLATRLAEATQRTPYRRVTSTCHACVRRDFIVTYVG